MARRPMPPLARVVAGGLLVALAAAAAPAAGARPAVVRTAAGSLGSGHPRQVSQHVDALAVAGSTVFAGDSVYGAVRAFDTSGRRQWIAAGTGNPFVGGAGGVAARVSTGNVTALAATPGGGFLVAGGGYVQRVERGRASVLAGGGTTTGTLVEGARAREVELGGVWGLALAADGTVYASDTNRHRVLGFRPDGTTTIVAGTGVNGSAGLGGPARTLSLSFPYGLAVTKAGDLLVADSRNHRVVRVDRLGISHAFAGIGLSEGSAGDGGPAVLAQLDRPTAVATTPKGDVLVAGRSFVRRVGADGVISRFGPFSTGTLAVAGNGDVFFTNGEGGVSVRRAGGAIAPIAGLPPAASFGYDGLGGGVPSRLQTWRPLGVAAYDGTLYWSDQDKVAWRLRGGRAAVITSNAEPFFDPVAGAYDEGRGVLLGSVAAIAAGPSGVLVSDDVKNRVYRLRGNGRYAVVGQSRLCPPWEEQAGIGDGGPANEALLCGPRGLAMAGRTLYIADTKHHRIRAVGADGRIRTVAGSGNAGFGGDGGRATRADLLFPSDVAVGPDGALYVADTENHVIRRIGRDGVIRTFAGTPGVRGYSGDGGAARSARLDYPEGVAVGRDGSVYVADSENFVIRRIDRRGVVTTFAGNGRNEFSDGTARAAGLGCPNDLAIDDAARRLYIADPCNTRVRVISF